MPELSGRELLHEWQRVMDSVVAAATTVAGRAELPRELVEPMRRQLELVEEVLERERRLQADMTRRIVAPFDAVFDLLGDSGEMLRRQAEALESAGRALEETAALMKSQAELFERTIEQMRRPMELAKSAAGVEPRAPKRKRRG